MHANRMVEHYYLALDSVCPAEKLEGTVSVGGAEINIGNSLLTRLSNSIPRTPKPG